MDTIKRLEAEVRALALHQLLWWRGKDLNIKMKWYTLNTILPHYNTILPHYTEVLLMSKKWSGSNGSFTYCSCLESVKIWHIDEVDSEGFSYFWSIVWFDFNSNVNLIMTFKIKSTIMKDRKSKCVHPFAGWIRFAE